MGSRSLLTGSLGLVGSEFLRRYLFWDDSSQITLLIRAKGNQSAQKRFEHLWSSLFPESNSQSEAMRSRVQVLEAKLHEPQFGLSAEIYTELTQSITHLFHFASEIRFDLTQDEAWNANVKSTESLIHFAKECWKLGQFQHFHYLSTFATIRSSNDSIVYEVPPSPPSATHYRNYYERSKAESEFLLLQEKETLPISIYRPSMIGGDSRTGWTSKFDTFYLFCRFFLSEIGQSITKIPLPKNGKIDAVSVDFVADSLYWLYLKSDQRKSGEIFHLTAGPQATPLASTLKSLLEFYSNHLENQEGKTFLIPELVELENYNEENALEFLKSTSPHGQEFYPIFQKLLPYAFDQCLFDHQNLFKTLEGTPVAVPQSLKEMIPVLLNYAIESNWGEKPGQRPPLNPFKKINASDLPLQSAESPPQPTDEPIAIVGLGAILPEANSVLQFWQNLKTGKNCLSEVPQDRWNPEYFYDADPESKNRTHGKLGGFIKNLEFDENHFKIPPKAAQSMDRLQKLVLLAAEQALGDAGLLKSEIQESTSIKTGMILGYESVQVESDAHFSRRPAWNIFRSELEAAFKESGIEGTTRTAVLERIEKEIIGSIDPISEDTLPGGLPNVAVGRVMNFFNLKGLSYVVNAGAGSSLAAIEHAIDCLKTRECDQVIAGGASAYLGPLQWICLAKENRLSSSEPRPFSPEAKGTVPSEGAVLFVLKRLSDALRDRNQIHAVIRGIGHASNGKSAGPERVLPETLQQAIQSALEQSQLQSSQINQIEAQASAIPSEDQCETQAIQAVFASPPPMSYLTPQLGCLFGASGAASTLKATLHLAFSKKTGTTPQRWGVNSFGIWGQAYHLILEEWNPQVHPQQLQFKPMEPPQMHPVAIVGMGAVLPQSKNIQEYWNLITSSQSAVQEMPESLWEGHRSAFFDSNPDQPDKTYGSLGAFAHRPEIDPIRFGIPPVILNQLDRVHLQFFEAAHQALQSPSDSSPYWAQLPKRTSLIIGESKGSGQTTWKLALKETFLVLETILRKPIIRERLNWGYSKVETLLENLQFRFPELAKPFDEDTRSTSLFPASLSRLGRIAQVRGGYEVVDAACGSSLAALGAAIRALRLKKQDCIVFGGVGLSVTPANAIPFARCRALSGTGSRPFDETADGIILGEGSAVFLLKRLEDALHQPEPIHAIIRGVGGSSDGRGHSMMAPSTSGQILAMKSALENAGVAPSEVDYVECHATGTPIGDESEVNSVAEIYCGDLSIRSDFLRVGSVKAQIGHTIGAAGAASLLKVVLGLKNEIYPPTPIATRVHPKFQFQTRKLKINSQPELWAPSAGKKTRMGAISAFGFGGTNWHALVEQAPQKPQLKPKKKTMTCAFVFPGHGSPYPDMGLSHFQRSAVFRSAFLEANEVLAPLLGQPIESLIYTQFGASREEIENHLLQPEIVQPVLLTLDIAYYRMLRDLKVRPHVVLGHSVGEFAAAVASNLLSFEQALWAIYQRGRIFKEHQQQGTDTGKMAAVFASWKTLSEFLYQNIDLPVVIANLNCPKQTVLSGPTAAIETAIQKLNSMGIESKLLKVQVAWHSPLALELGHSSVQKVFESLEVNSPQIRILSNVDLKDYTAEAQLTQFPNLPPLKEQLVRNWVAQLGAPMNFINCIEKLYAEGIQNFIEVGPRKILSSFISDILENRPHRIWATDQNEKSDSGLTLRQMAQEIHDAQ